MSKMYRTDDCKYVIKYVKKHRQQHISKASKYTKVCQNYSFCMNVANIKKKWNIVGSNPAFLKE